VASVVSNRWQRHGLIAHDDRLRAWGNELHLLCILPVRCL
jgi:hypothetical protein